MAVRDIHVGAIPVRALRVTYTGELGWELHHPSSTRWRCTGSLRGPGPATA